MGAGISNASFAEGKGNIQLLGKTMLYPTANVSNGVANLYTVPAGKTFFLIGHFLRMRTTTLGDSSSIYGGALLVDYLWAPANGTANSQLSYANPIPFPTGTAFTIGASATTTAIGLLIGWEE